MKKRLTKKEKGHVLVAKKAFSSYLHLKPSEKVLIIMDKKAEKSQKYLSRVALSAIKHIGSSADIYKINRWLSKSKIDSIFKDYPVIFDMSKATHGTPFFDHVPFSKSRMVSLIGAESDLFSPNGALDENFKKMTGRLKRLKRKLTKACGFRITTLYGTNLYVPLKPNHQRKWCICNGEIKSGSWDNWPGGEIFTTPDENKVKGKLVLHSFDNAKAMQQPVDKPIEIEVKKGLIVSIKGGKAATQLKKEMKRSEKETKANGDDPRNVYRVGEIGFGANSLARLFGSTIESEKRHKTVHVAFGSGKHEEEGADGNYDAASHLDFVLPYEGLSVSAFLNSKNFKKNKNPISIINS